MANITYIGGNVVDWNTSIDKGELGGIAEIAEKGDKKDKKKPTFKFHKEERFELSSGDSKSYLKLPKDKEFVFDKNYSERGWNMYDILPDGKKATRTFDCLRRPGGGPTNNVHVAGTLARSMNSNVSLDLLVLQESRFVKDILRSELSGANFEYGAVRASNEEINNVSFVCNGDKITYAGRERELSAKEAKTLDEKLGSISSEDMIVINSVKDDKYLSKVLDWYDNGETKPTLVAAVTGSMISKMPKSGKGLDVKGLVKRSDIYVSNIEELYDLLSSEVYAHRGSWKELDDHDLYVGMKHILNKQKESGSKSRVYLTCGDHGCVAMDSDENLYFQRVSSIIGGPTQETPIVDLNGAGDTFAGAMTLLEAEGKYNIMEILDYASAAAQISVKHPGANGPDRITRDSIHEFRNYHTQDIWKYNPQAGSFSRMSSMKCNL